MKVKNILNHKRIGFIGAGNMATAIIRGLLASNKTRRTQIYISDKDDLKKNAKTRNLGIKSTIDNVKLVSLSDIVIICVKPQDIRDVLEQLSSERVADKIIISIAAGVKLSFIHEYLSKGVKLVRVMPNIGSLAREAISAISYSKRLDTNSKRIARSIFEAIGEIEEVDEKQMDVVTAISGSGPAYIAYLLNSLIKSAKKNGLTEVKARHFVYQVNRGALALLKQRNIKPTSLIKIVASKGGTTEAALRIFKKKKLHKIINEAIKAATNRSKELSKS